MYFVECDCNYTHGDRTFLPDHLPLPSFTNLQIEMHQTEQSW